MIHLAKITDIEDIINIANSSKDEMKQEQNPQWQDSYINKDKFLNDIKNNSLYVLLEDNTLKGFIVITDETHEYDELLKTSTKRAYILHRLAIKKEFRHQGLASKLFEFVDLQARENNIEILKADTEEHNIKMQHLFTKVGFKKIAEFNYTDYPGHYIYYEKEIN